MRWLIGGLVGGAVVLGLLIGAYAIGYDHGKKHGGGGVAAAKPAPSTKPAPAGGGGAQAPTGAALVAKGRQLFTSDGCAGCHSLNGSAGAGPTLQGVSGRTVALADGTTVKADAAYLSESITDPDAKIVKGYPKGLMSAGIASFHLSPGSQDVQALVAFLETRR